MTTTTEAGSNPECDSFEETKLIVRGLVQLINDDQLVEVESAQPGNLTQHEAKDSDGNAISFVSNGYGPACPIEVRNSKGKLIAQSWDCDGWAVNHYIEYGIDFVLSEGEGEENSAETMGLGIQCARGTTRALLESAENEHGC